MWDSLVDEIRHLKATGDVGVASYTFLVYDHLLTFGDEVEYLWKGRKGPVVYLFFFIRYFFLFAFIINLYAYISPDFSEEMCKHFVRYEGAMTITAFGVTGLMMFLRVNALYGGNCRPVQFILGTLWLAKVGVYAWLLSKGRPVPHSDGVRGCSLIFDPRHLGASSLSAIAPLTYDTAVIILTMYKIIGKCRKNQQGGWKSGNVLIKTLIKDGVLYYNVLTVVNLAWMIMILTASPGIKNILGQFSQLMAVTMMSRITLHLREVGARRGSIIISNSSRPTSSYCPDESGQWSESSAEGSEVAFAGTSRRFVDSSTSRTTDIGEASETSMQSMDSKSGSSTLGGIVRHEDHTDGRSAPIENQPSPTTIYSGSRSQTNPVARYEPSFDGRESQSSGSSSSTQTAAFDSETK